MDIDKIDIAENALANLKGLAETLDTIGINEPDVSKDQIDLFAFIIRSSVESLESIIER